MRKPHFTSRISCSLARPIGYSRPRINTLGAVLREIVALQPDYLIISVNGRIFETTLDVLAETLVRSGADLHRICPIQVTVPRPGWAVIVPRPAMKRRTS